MKSWWYRGNSGGYLETALPAPSAGRFRCAAMRRIGGDPLERWLGTVLSALMELHGCLLTRHEFAAIILCQRRLIQAASSRLDSIKKRRLPQTTTEAVPTAPTLEVSVSADRTQEEHEHQMDCSDKFEDDGMLTSDTDDLKSPTAGGLSLVTKADVACQTESSATGKLTIFLSMTNCDEASTQVTHTEQTDQVTGTDGSWRRSCSFHGFNSLQGNEEALQDMCGVTLPVFSLLLNLLPTSRYKSTDVTREDKLCLFLAKLRLGITYSALAVIFGVSATTASNIFKKILEILSVVLQEWVYVPPREVIKLSMPPAFKVNYPNCSFIIDCSEIRTEMPSKPDCQHVLYSNYKAGYTVKFLVGIIPNGMITFVSKVYGGRHTDSFITQDSGFLELIKPGDLVLSDKGFPSIRTNVEGKGGVLLMPPFNSGGQMSEEAMDSTYKIAAVRIHVERVIQRLKIYKILSNRLPLSLVPHMSKVLSVCAALVNMQPPIVKK
nr:uncharacterized protein LOC126523280 [Dermacentor andersoni]